MTGADPDGGRRQIERVGECPDGGVIGGAIDRRGRHPHEQAAIPHAVQAGPGRAGHDTHFQTSAAGGRDERDGRGSHGVG